MDPICPTCLARRPGDDLCPLHPEASAHHDRRRKQKKMINQLDDVCAWTSTHNLGAPQATAHILAFICDKCGYHNTVSLCDQCARNWTGSAPQSRCGTCNGTLSWKIYDIQTGDTIEQINPSQLP